MKSPNENDIFDMVIKMKFVCKKCGMCCRNLHLNDLYKDLHEGDGICKYLDEQTNLCTIYENRPLLCNVDKAYEVYFKDTYSKEEYYKLNMRSCDYLGKTKRDSERK